MIWLSEPFILWHWNIEIAASSQPNHSGNLSFRAHYDYIIAASSQNFLKKFSEIHLNYKTLDGFR